MFESSLLFRHGIRFSFFGKPPLFIRRSSHIKLKCSSRQKVGMSNIHLIINLSVQLHLPDIAITIAHLWRFYFESAVIGQIHTDIRQIRCSQYILVSTRANRIKSHCRKKIPGRHLAAIVIAAQAVNIIFLHPVHDRPQPVLRLPGLGSPSIQIRNVMTRLIAMYIPSHQTYFSNIFILFVIFAGKCH